jgi:hypothetical protein
MCAAAISFGASAVLTKPSSMVRKATRCLVGIRARNGADGPGVGWTGIAAGAGGNAGMSESFHPIGAGAFAVGVSPEVEGVRAEVAPAEALGWEACSGALPHPDKADAITAMLNRFLIMGVGTGTTISGTHNLGGWSAQPNSGLR